MSRAMKIAACVALLGLWAVLFLRVLADRKSQCESLAREIRAVEARRLHEHGAALSEKNNALKEEVEVLRAQNAELEKLVRDLKGRRAEDGQDRNPPGQTGDIRAQVPEGNGTTVEDLRREVATLKDLLAQARAEGRADADARKLKALERQQVIVRAELKDLAERMLQTAQYDSAQRLLESAVKLGGDTPRVLFDLAYCCNELGDDEAAAEWYGRAAQATETAPQAGADLLAKLYSNYGATLVRLAKPQEALQCYQKAVETDKDYPAVHFNLGRLYAQHLRKPAEAVRAYRRHMALGGKRSAAARKAVLKLLDENPEIEARGDAPAGP